MSFYLHLFQIISLFLWDVGTKHEGGERKKNIRRCTHTQKKKILELSGRRVRQRRVK
jgi:hypothetical protein